MYDLYDWLLLGMLISVFWANRLSVSENWF